MRVVSICWLALLVGVAGWRQNLNSVRHARTFRSITLLHNYSCFHGTDASVLPSNARDVDNAHGHQTRQLVADSRS